jgi:hypothetical protein
MDRLTALPTWQYVFVGITGSLTILTSLYMLRHGNIAPFAVVAVIAFALYMTWKRIQPSVMSQPPPPANETAFTVFRNMEPADQTRVNPWVGILQEDVYANRTGPIGTFVGNDDVTPSAPLYPFTSG